MKATKFGAPFVPLEPDVVEHVMLHAQIKPGDIFYELGSGDGRLVIAAAMRGAKAYGVEIDRWRVLYSKLWIKLLRLSSNATILHQNIFQTDLSEANVVCFYLLQSTANSLREKLEKELKRGSKVISVAFYIPGWKPVKVDRYGPIYGPIYIYQR